MMRTVDEEKEKIYPHLRSIGKRLTKSFNDLAEDQGITALATGLPYEDPVAFSTDYFSRPIPLEKEYLWKTGPTTFEDYDAKAGFAVGGQANHVVNLSMVSNGISSFRGASFILCTKHNDEDTKLTEEAFRATIRLLKDNNLAGKTE